MTDLIGRHPRRDLFGLRIDAMTLDEVVELADVAVRTRRRLLVGVVNAAKIVHLRSDPLLRSSLLECDVLLADGQSVVWASRLLGEPLPERVAGIDLFEQLLARADRDRRAVYLLGATPSVLDAVETAVDTRWPGARVVGSRDGYFDASQSGEVAASIAASGADMLFIAMPSPKKEIFLGTYGATLGVPVMHGVGGSFDVIGGLTRRAPARWQRWGLEWLYRVLQEPGRLWRRYLTTNTAFMVLLLRERVRRTTPYVPTSTTAKEGTAHE
ncbi:WecB/TagA/CpsF family glycosyltransferase [Aeromicrobium wangtongii]|uniref:WecB/TagA/CpsF family glycosyltransferase n=1 Tax=Aeromicrobium wangtongii TaxID=2969247 RepID=UPI0020181EF3|nr:WecB/TagA/CpsF family glycosyltransferase [Aeromicrobium wangtongii]MCL3817845.1 WecB/TagA/CpsF family glycosyltransferase [Aeromicrobium wangtongii]